MTDFHGPIDHIRELRRKISSAIGTLKRIRSLISQPTAVQIFDALIQPQFYYRAPVWDGLSSYLCEKLQKLKNRAARVILQASCEVNSSLLLETLKWEQLSLRRRKQKAIMICKSLNRLVPVYRCMNYLVSVTQTMTCVILSVS